MTARTGQFMMAISGIPPTKGTNVDSVKERVARGAAELDIRRPGWAEEIDPWMLRMESCTHCIMGQLVGAVGRYLSIFPDWPDARRDYYLTYTSLYVTTDHPLVTHGLWGALRDVPDDLMDLEYNELTQAWILEIERRRPLDRRF